MRQRSLLPVTLALLATCQRSAPAQERPRQPAPAPATAVTADVPVTTPTSPVAPPSPPPPARREPMNVILLTIDSLRADMPWAGYPRPIAPFLTRLEAESVSYTRAYALSSYTSMSVGGFLGGRLPGELRRDGYFFGTYPRSVVFFPERLQEAGVRTFGAHAHGYFRARRAGFDQGFDHWELLPNLRWDPTTDVEITGDRHAAAARRLFSDPQNTSGRFFAWFHFMDPHDQYREHPGISYGRRLRDRYDGEVTYTDQQLEGLVTWIRQQPWASRTAIIVSADHGESLGEHNHYRHGFQVWQQLIRVPWFFVVPGARARRVEVPRSHIDLAPTVLDLMGVAPEPEFTGRSLVPEILGAAAEERDVWVDLPRTSNNDRRRVLIHGRHKLTAYGDDHRFELFDIEADPEEAHNLSREQPELFREMVARYRAAQSGFRDEHPYACRNLQGAPPGRGW